MSLEQLVASRYVLVVLGTEGRSTTQVGAFIFPTFVRMGFGFNLLFAFVLLPLFVVSLVLSTGIVVFTGKDRRYRTFMRMVVLYLIAFGSLVGFVCLVSVVQWWKRPIKFERDDVAGRYRVDRSMFPGPQADWQHEHFTLYLRDDNWAMLVSTDEQGKSRAWMRRFHYRSGRPYLWSFDGGKDSSQHHVLSSTPTLYRKPWGYYYVVRSPRFGNMFFRKDEPWL